MARFDVNCSILFTELPILQRPAAARAAGFTAVEFWWPWSVAVPPDAEVDDFVGALRDAGVRWVGLNFFAGDMPAGDRGLVAWPGRSAEFRDNLDVAVSIGEQLGCRAFNALYGSRVPDTTPERQDELPVENLTLAGAAASRIGGVVPATRSSAITGIRSRSSGSSPRAAGARPVSRKRSPVPTSSSPCFPTRRTSRAWPSARTASSPTPNTACCTSTAARSARTCRPTWLPRAPSAASASSTPRSAAASRGGRRIAIDHAPVDRPVLKTVGKTVVHVCPPGAGQTG